MKILSFWHKLISSLCILLQLILDLRELLLIEWMPLLDLRLSLLQHVLGSLQEVSLTSPLNSDLFLLLVNFRLERVGLRSVAAEALGLWEGSWAERALEFAHGERLGLDDVRLEGLTVVFVDLLALFGDNLRHFIFMFCSEIFEIENRLIESWWTLGQRVLELSLRKLLGLCSPLVRGFLLLFQLLGILFLKIGVRNLCLKRLFSINRERVKLLSHLSWLWLSLNDLLGSRLEHVMLNRLHGGLRLAVSSKVSTKMIVAVILDIWRHEFLLKLHLTIFKNIWGEEV